MNQVVESSGQSAVISMRIPQETNKSLRRMAARHGWTPSDTSARLVEEGLRRAEFAFLDFRDSAVGRQAYLQGSSLAIWEVIALVREYKDDLQAVAEHLGWRLIKVQAAVNYAKAFPKEIDAAIAENEEVTLESLQRMLPNTTQFIVSEQPRRPRAKTTSR